MDDQETLLKQVFGESSDSDSDDCEQPQQHENRSENFGQTPSWLRIKEINGLYLCVDFLSPQHQSSLLSAIQNEGWFTDASHNQAMRFGDLPTWATKLSDSIREAVLLSDNDLATCDGDKEVCPLPSDLLWREPLFDQLIVNVYQPGHLCAC